MARASIAVSLRKSLLLSVPAWAVAVASAHAACAPAVPASGQSVTCTGTNQPAFVAPAGVTGLTVTNTAGSSITGVAQTVAGANAQYNSVQVNDTSTVINNGTISPSLPATSMQRDYVGVGLNGSAATLTNNGSITLSNPATAPGSATYRLYGVITSSNGADFSNVGVVNNGSITISQSGTGIARGIYAGENIALMSIDNFGSISVTRVGNATQTSAVGAIDSDDDTVTYGVRNRANATLSSTGANTFTVQGRATAFSLTNEGTVTQSGGTGAAILIWRGANTATANAAVTNAATGTINGDVYLVDRNPQTGNAGTFARDSQITNAGTINGSIYLGRGTHTVTNTNTTTGISGSITVDQVGTLTSGVGTFIYSLPTITGGTTFTLNNTGRIGGGLTFNTVAASRNTLNLGTGSTIGGAITATGGLGINNINLSGTGTFTSTVTGFTNITQTAGAWTIGNNSIQTISGNLTVAGGTLTLGAGTTQNVSGLVQVTGSGAQLTVNNTLNHRVDLSNSNTSLVNNGTITQADTAATTTAGRLYSVISNSTGADFANVNVVNTGTISITANGAGRAQGVYAGENIASMTVTNSGLITATRSASAIATGSTQAVAAVDSDDDVTALAVVNQTGGRITATGTGARAVNGRAKSYTVDNAGTITGPTGGQAIVLYGAGTSTIVNRAGATINGDVQNIDVNNQTAASAVTAANRRLGMLTNAGTINGNLLFGQGNQTVGNTGTISGNITFLDVATAGAVTGSVNRLTLGTGSVIGGNIAAQGLGNNALVLTGTGTLTSNVTGFTTLSQADGSWVLASGSTQTFSGGATISGGRLEVDSTLNANTDVGAAGTLPGIGRIVGNLTNAGMVAPGTAAAPYGTLTVVNAYTQTSGGALDINVNAAGANSKLQVNGLATLSGAVNLTTAPGTYTANQRYTVLTANTGVVGNFTSASASGLPFLLRPVATTDSNNAYVTLAQQSFTGVAQTQNQRNAATGLDVLLANNPAALTFLDYQSNAALAGILDRVAGQGYTSLADPQMRSGRAFTDALMGRAYSGLFEAGPTGFTLPPAVYAADLPKRGPVPEPRYIETSRGYSLWGVGYGQTGRVDSTANAAGRSETITGAAVGIDAHPAPGSILGLAAGYGSVDVTVTRTGERAHTDNAQVGIYGGVTSGPLYAIGTVGYAHADGRLNRSLAGLQPLQPGGARGGVSGDQFLSAGEAGYRFAYAAGSILTPFVGVQVTTFSQDRVVERNNGLFDLTGASRDFVSARSLVGGRLESSFDLGGRAVTLGIKAAYVHDYADVSRTIQSAFVLAPALPFTVAGRRLDRDRAQVGVALGTMLAPGWTGYVAYDGEFASSDNIQSGRAGVRYSF